MRIWVGGQGGRIKGRGGFGRRRRRSGAANWVRNVEWEGGFVERRGFAREPAILGSGRVGLVGRGGRVHTHLWALC